MRENKKPTGNTALGLIVIVILILATLVIQNKLSVTSNVPVNGVTDNVEINAAQNKLGFELTIPKYILQENNIKSRVIMGEMLEIENEHIVLRAAKFIAPEIDVSGMYDMFETETWICNANGKLYRLRGHDSERLYVLNWMEKDITYSCYLKPGMEYSMALVYIGAIETLEEVESLDVLTKEEGKERYREYTKEMTNSTQENERTDLLKELSLEEISTVRNDNFGLIFNIPKEIYDNLIVSEVENKSTLYLLKGDTLDVVIAILKISDGANERELKLIWKEENLGIGVYIPRDKRFTEGTEASTIESWIIENQTEITESIQVIGSDYANENESELDDTTITDITQPDDNIIEQIDSE